VHEGYNPGDEEVLAAAVAKVLDAPRYRAVGVTPLLALAVAVRSARAMVGHVFRGAVGHGFLRRAVVIELVHATLERLLVLRRGRRRRRTRDQHQGEEQDGLEHGRMLIQCDRGCD
jgi:hypothetical protein